MWVIPPLPPGASRADREWHRREMAATEREIKYIWTNACQVTRLVQRIPPPGAIFQAPLVGSITLDSVPARFSVKLRPGQLPGDFAKKADRFAAAYGVPTVEVVPLTQDERWISVRLVEPIWIEWYEEPVPVPVPPNEPHPTARGNPLGRRQDRRRAGGPRSLRRRRHRTLERPGGRSHPSRDPGPATALGNLFRSFVEFWRLPEPVDPDRETAEVGSAP
jgi:hypothetical protein